MRGSRVYIPPSLRKKVLTELHVGHFGTTKMKLLARSYCWWPGIDNDISQITANCMSCVKIRNNPVKTSHPWEPSTQPFQRVHCDFAGPFQGYYFFILVDSYTKWPEIFTLRNITTKSTIDACLSVFSRFGIPDCFVTDCGTQFQSQEFQSFLQSYGIHYKFTAPYHPATNGQAERYVQTLKKSLKAMLYDNNNTNMMQKVNLLLMQYRKMPNITTGKSPSLLMFGREIKTRLDKIIPVEGLTLTDESAETKSGNNCTRQFPVGVRVAARNYQGDKWLFGRVHEVLGTLHYLILLDNGKMIKRHVDQIISVGENIQKDNSNIETFISPPMLKATTASDPSLSQSPHSDKISTSHTSPSVMASPNRSHNSDCTPESVRHHDNSESSQSENLGPRRSSRVRRPVVRMNL
nr:unnamed protein product [Callosobruchus analis]